jgi:hypothetical protein
MRYRLEDGDCHLLVRHVETDREVGVALEQLFFDLKGGVFDLCSSYNMAGVKLATVSSQTVRSPLRTPAIALAHHEEANGFPDLKGAAWNDHAGRVERRLGSLIADTALAFARGFCEAVGPGLTPTTRDQFAGSLAELAALWRVSCVGCFNATTNREEPYFANPEPSGPRLNFPSAAQVYGMPELRARHPDLTDAERQKALNWVLQWLRDALLNELENQRRSETQNNL